MAREDRPVTEMPEQVFRQSEAYGHVAAAKADRKRRLRAEFRARWPLGRIVRLALIYAAPLIVLVGWYWAGRAVNMVGGG